MKIYIDPERCTGHGVCENLAEDLFEVRHDGRGHVLEPSVPHDRLDIVRAAVEQCPTRALSART